MSPPPAASASVQPSIEFPGLALRRSAPPVPVREPRMPATDSVAVARIGPTVERPLLGIGLILGSTLFFSASDVMAKMLATSLPAVELAWIRYLVFLSIVAPTAFVFRGRAAFQTRRPGLQVLRGLGMAGSSLLFIFSLRYLQVADATATNFVAPIFITALSVVFLREKVGIRRWAATAVGLVGVLIVVRPGPDILQSAALLPAVSALVWAVAAIATRMMAGTEPPETTLVYSAVVGFGLLSMAVPFVWVTPTADEAMMALAFGVGSTIGHGFVVLAFRHGAASLLAPFSYAQLVWATAFGWLAFGVFPTVWTLVGGAVIAASGLYIAHREHVRARDAKVTSV
jgi:drug/metabolite transporter (DMT)-like permease